MMQPTTRAILVAGLIALGFIPVAAVGQDYPSRALNFLVPYSVGGTIDRQLRALASATEKHFGRPIVVENKASANGLLPAIQIATTPPDDYTVTPIHVGVLRQPFMAKVPYDPATDFTYIIGITEVTAGLVVRADAPWKTFEEFLADAKAHPGKITYGSPGGSLNPAVVMQQIARQRGIEWVQVPFKSFAESGNALLGGHVQAVSDAAGWAPLVNSGDLRLLVTYDAHRTKNWPSVPSLSEFGINAAVNSAYGLGGSKGMDPAAVKYLHDAFKKGMEEPAFVEVLNELNQQPVYQNTADYRAYVLREIQVQKRVVQELGLNQE